MCMRRSALDGRAADNAPLAAARAARFVSFICVFRRSSCAKGCACARGFAVTSAAPRPRDPAAPRLHGGSAAPRGAARRCGGTARQIGCGLSRPATAVRGATRVVVVMVVVTTARACHAEEIPGCATSHWPNKRRSTKAGSGFFSPREQPLRALLFFFLSFSRDKGARACATRPTWRR